MLVAMLSCAFTACEKNEPAPDKDPHDTIQRTVMIYMLADNNLDSYDFDTKNINSIKSAFGENAIDGRMIIFKSSLDQEKCILEIAKKSNDLVFVDTLKHYNSDIDPTDPATMRQIFTDMHTLAPAHSYGLIMWSHATGWLPDNHYYKAPARTPQHAFGREGNSVKSIDINEIRTALADFHFDFILFDACLMASVEVAYELRNICDYIIASPTETMGDGHPYYEMTPMLYDNTIDYIKVCEAYTDLYITNPSNDMSGTIALINTHHLEELSALCRTIVAGRDEDIARINTSQIQYYDRKMTHVFFDLEHYLRQLTDEAQHEALLKVMDKVVPYKAHSRKFLTVTIKNYCGLSCYIPGSSNNSVVEDYYSLLQWSEDVYGVNN